MQGFAGGGGAQTDQKLVDPLGDGRFDRFGFRSGLHHDGQVLFERARGVLGRRGGAEGWSSGPEADSEPRGMVQRTRAWPPLARVSGHGPTLGLDAADHSTHIRVC